ncbi:DUF6176 family protein [Furfurilactobacillus milii]|uniref:DUF6176 family protein n=1 Tax=Furfurilactobacillus milii TaxID=2888272 RepID=UPI001F3EE8A6|nr:DUF6176 family protein [Furfurilactobacillus milii]MCF6418479.1 DUF6176 family protein [Furfurilactobacillus milii]
MKTELEGFRVKSDKHVEAQEWLKFLADNRQAFLATLPAEKMLVESVFSTMIGNDLYLCWYSIQGDNPRPVEDSESELDKRHVAYWEDCIDESVPSLKFDHVVNYVPDELMQKMSRLYEN